MTEVNGISSLIIINTIKGILNGYSYNGEQYVNVY